MPIIFRNRAGAGALLPVFEEIVNRLNPGHIWKFEETVNAYADSGAVGGLTLAQANLEQPFRLPGLFRDGQFINGYWMAADESSDYLTRAVGVPAAGWATGGFFCFIASFDNNNDGNDLINLFNQSYSSATAQQLQMNINLVTGVPEFSLAFGGALGTMTVTGSPGDYTLNEPHMIGVIQRGDGNGPRIVIDGVDINATISQSGSANNDNWVQDVVTPTPTQALDFGRRNFGGAVARHCMCLPMFLINNAPPDSDLLAVFNAANMRGTPIDYFSYMFENFAFANPLHYFWTLGWVASAGSGNRSMITARGADNVQDPLCGTGNVLRNQLDTDILVPASYQKYCYDFGNAGGANPRIQHSGARKAIPIAGVTAGTISIAVRLDNNFNTAQTFFEYGFRFGAAQYSLRLRLVPGTTGGLLSVNLQTTSAGPDQWDWQDTTEITSQQVVMLTVVQDGNPGAPQIYVNDTLSPVAPTIGANFNGSEWLQAIQAAGHNGTHTEGNDNTLFNSRLRGRHLDSVVTPEVLTAQQVADRWAALSGTIGFTYRGTLTVGQQGTSPNFTYGFSFGSLGNLTPIDWGPDGDQIAQIFAGPVASSPPGSQLRLTTFAFSIPGVNLVNLSIEGAPNNPYRLAVENNGAYFLASENSPDLYNYLATQVGNNLEVTISPVLQTFDVQGAINPQNNAGTVGYQQSVQGSLTPLSTALGDPFDAATPRTVAFLVTATDIQWEFTNNTGSVQYQGANQIEVSVEGAPLASYLLTWNGSNRYVRTNADANGLLTHLTSGPNQFNWGFNAA